MGWGGVGETSDAWSGIIDKGTQIEVIRESVGEIQIESAKPKEHSEKRNVSLKQQKMTNYFVKK